MRVHGKGDAVSQLHSRQTERAIGKLTSAYLQQGSGAAGVADGGFGCGELTEEDDGHGVTVAGEVATDEHLKADED